jgi:hypothetical protein
MKNFFFSTLTLLFMLGIMQTGEAKMMEVQGDIVVTPGLGKSRVNLQSLQGDFKLVELSEQALGCSYGVFWIIPEFHAGEGSESYRVIDVLDCLDQTDARDLMVCPEIYAPVCGSDKGQPVTFGNMCELEFNRAQLIDKGECDR